MTPIITLSVIVIYFAIILIIASLTSKDSSNSTFFSANKKANWIMVSFGMIGASLSGVTFISVPGWVNSTGFTYLQMVMGYIPGYLFVALVLLPVYYKLKLTSIYEFLNHRFGTISYKSGAIFFLLSRTLGSSIRLFLVAQVLHITIFGPWHVPFFVTVFITIALIWLYTFKGGINTIIYTDVLQTFFMLSATIVTIYFVINTENLSFKSIISLLHTEPYGQLWVFDDFHSKQNFFKQFLSGAFITIVMTGLDQDMMQKNLTCRNLKEAQKNMIWYGSMFAPVNLLFLFLGFLLVYFIQSHHLSMPERADALYPMLATGNYFPPVVGFMFIVGLIAAAYSSADSALTALTTSFMVDILGKGNAIETKTRFWVHLMFSCIMLVVILIFRAINNTNVIDAIFTIAGYTYGPLLGIFALGLFTKIKLNERFVPYIFILSPILSYVISVILKNRFNWVVGYELLMINGLTTFFLLMLLQNKKNNTTL